MCIFSIFVDEGIQSLWDDSAVVGGKNQSIISSFYREILFVSASITQVFSLGGLYWFRIKVSLRIH